MVWRALSLPLLEPLTAGRQQRLARLCAACLLAALTVAASGAAAAAAPDEAEKHAVDVLVHALEVLECVQSVLRASTRSGGHVSWPRPPGRPWCAVQARRPLWCVMTVTDVDDSVTCGVSVMRTVQGVWCGR